MEYAWLIPALPAVAAAFIALFGKHTPEKGGWIAVLFIGTAGALSVGVFFEGWQLWKSGAANFGWDAPFLRQIEWWSAGDFTINFGVYIDPLSIFMLLVVGILVTLIALYSTAYMHEEGDGRRRYYAVLALFITGMLGLVVSSNYLMLFLFWEIMGLCSYLLIGYWFTKPSAASAAKKAFLTTRVGDAFFLLGIGILFVHFKSLDFDTIFAAAASGAEGVSHNVLLVANLCIFAGAVGKSAQFPLHTWLPDAMEGPTTVSALIHAATMVKAGVFLVARSYPLFVLTPEVLLVVAIVGGFTALFAATMALTNWDLKRVLAYSTLSQLGYMFLGLGVAGALFYAEGAHGPALAAVALTGVTVAIFHLFSHAFFKAGLFLSAGSVGHAVHSYDMRRMGGLAKAMPITAFAMLMGTISISGIPIFAGFFSKDAILERVFEAAHDGASIYYVLYGMAVLTAALTAYYMFRLYFLTFTGEYRGRKFMRARGLEAVHDAEESAEHDHGHEKAHLHESPWAMTVPLAILGTVAIVGGAIALGIAGGDFGRFIHASDGTQDAALAATGVEAGSLKLTKGIAAAIAAPFSHATTYVSIAAGLAGLAVAWVLWNPRKVEANIPSGEPTGLAKLWAARYHIDALYDHVFGKLVLAWAAVTDWFDREVVDGAVNGVAWTNQRGAQRIRRWNTGNVQDYVLTVAGGFVLIVLFVIYAPQVPGWWEQIRDFAGGFLGGATG